MALITRSEADEMFQRNTVSDVRPLVAAYLELLEHAGHEVEMAAELAALQRRVDELQIIVDNRAAHRSTGDALADELDALKAQLPVEKPKARKKTAAR